MKIVNITGGLGNQMFQYAFALSLKEKFPQEDIYIDTQHYHTLFFKHFRGINLHNGFEIESVFPNAGVPIAGWKELVKISYFIPNYILSRIGRKILPIRNTEMVLPFSNTYSYLPEAYKEGNCYYEGFWQNIKYFEDIKDKLAEVYAHPEPNEYNRCLIKGITERESVRIDEPAEDTAEKILLAIPVRPRIREPPTLIMLTCFKEERNVTSRSGVEFIYLKPPIPPRGNSL